LVFFALATGAMTEKRVTSHENRPRRCFLLFSGTVNDALRHRDLMVSGSIDRAILHLGAPAALAALLQAGFLVVDTFWLGRVGAVAIAAASTAGFVMWLAQTLGEGTANGSGAVLANAVGADNEEGARRAASAGQALAVWGAAAVSSIGLATASAVFVFMGTAVDVGAAGVGYLRVILLGMPAYFVFVWLSAAFRATGDARTPLKLLAIAASVNLVVDPILIFGLGPFPVLGVTGAALATVASWIASAGWGWVLLGRLGLRPLVRDLARPPLDETWRSLRVGVPLGLEGAFFSVIYILLTRVTTDFGTPAVAALGVGHKLELLNYFVCAGMGAAATTLVGQNLGAGQPDRAARAAWRTLLLTCLPVGAVTLALVSFPEHAVAVFNDDPEVVAAGSTYVLLVGMSQLFMAFEVVLLASFAGAEWTAIPAAVEIGFTAARVPVAIGLVALGLGVEAVWIAIAATTVVKGVILGVLFLARHGRG
jgi:putative MATE family efflux protein